IAALREALPANARAEVDHRARLGRLDRFRPQPNSRRRPVEDVAHRQPELGRERPECLHGRHHAIELDRGDQARRDADAPGELPTADAEALTLEAELAADLRA